MKITISSVPAFWPKKEKEKRKRSVFEFHKNPWQPRLSSYIVMQYTKWDKLGLADVSSILYLVTVKADFCHQLEGFSPLFHMLSKPSYLNQI